MQARTLRSAPAEHLEDLGYLTAHLKADPHAAEIIPDLDVATAALEARIANWNSKRHAVQEAQTGLKNSDEILRNAARHAHEVILDDLRRNRRSARFLTYFPHGQAPFTRSSYQDLLTAVRSLTQQCAEDPSSKVQEQVTLLQAAVDQTDAAFARRAGALGDEGAAYGRLQVQKLQTIGACRRAAARLTELYPEDADRVRSYFRTTTRRRRPTGPASGEPAAEVPAATTGPAAKEAAVTEPAADATPARPTLALASAPATP
jgi:hypothetical protein